ncbi:MAG: helix-turn-helix transcriptional regulator [Candidatus Omnitrophica bacterium]|nr:helix-turn-helix transcriptional regulator [Candidatus Omnitrophota bacterium]
MFGLTLKRLREEKKLTQEDLASRLSVSRQAVCMWERGVRTPKIGVLTKVAGIFAVPIDYMVNGNKHFENNTQKNRRNR